MVLITDAAAEPISVADFKTHAKVDGSSEDATTIPLYIAAARKHFEAMTNRALITQTWEIYFDHVPKYIYFPITPVQSVTYIKYLDGSDSEQTLDASSYKVDTNSYCHRVEIIDKPSITSRIAGFWVRFVAGYGDAATDVPDDIIQAVTYMATQFYDNRTPVVTGTVVNEVPGTFDALCRPHKFYSIA